MRISGICASILILWGGMAMAETATIRVACMAERAGETVAGSICTLFAARIAAAYPAADVVADTQHPDVTLIVAQAGVRRFGGHIQWRGAQPGEPLAQALSGGALTDDTRAQLLDSLIAGTPRP